MKSSVLLLMGALFLGSPVSAQTWNLVWSDEFTSPTINSSNWTYDIGGNGWGNSEWEYYTNHPQNAVIDGGNLLIIARKESYSGSNYTSARLKTQGLRSFTYGKVEARIKLPKGQGLWPAFWMLGNTITTIGWPGCGEIDIMEHVSNSSLVNGTMHWDNNGHAQYGGTVPCDITQYHVYAIEWNANSINWRVDGAQYWTGNIANNINSTNEFHAPFFIIMNLAVGGNWPGYPDSTTSFPDTMFVDYIRVSQLVTGVNEGTNETPNHSELLQNYPNPFNPTTEISYHIGGIRGEGSGISDVRLILYDILGREVTTLVNEKKSVGSYSAKFDASGMSSGVYLYRLFAGNMVQTRSMVFMK